MNVVRSAFPALVGLLLLYSGWTSIVSNTGARPDRSEGLIESLAFGVIPIGLGIAFLIGAFAIARQARSGLVIGFVTALVGVVACLGILVAEIPYLDDEGFGGAIAKGVVLTVGVATLLPLGYGYAMWRSRSSFAPTWARIDRLAGAAIVAVAVTTATISLAGRVSADAADAQSGADAARAQALVAATTLEARVLDADVEDAASGALPATVARLSLELKLESPEPFDLLSLPTLCLTDLATFRDGAYKPGAVCWGGPGQAIELASAFSGLAITKGSTSFQLDMDDATTACAFPPGPWVAELRLSPRVGAVSQAELYTVTAEFDVPGGTPGAAPGASGTSAGADCMVSSP